MPPAKTIQFAAPQSTSEAEEMPVTPTDPLRQVPTAHGIESEYGTPEASTCAGVTAAVGEGTAVVEGAVVGADDTGVSAASGVTAVTGVGALACCRAETAHKALPVMTEPRSAPTASSASVRPGRH